MDEARFYWTVVVAVVSAGWVVTAFIRDRASQAVDRSSAMVVRLLESDKLIIDNPSIQKYLSQNAGQDEEYFRNQTILK
ncbi:MAG: hypothetical protein H7X83_05105 [Verrucomicrobia bacterium]|nr:hypothetical protein [Deltaproteobacteria bacterium]